MPTITREKHLCTATPTAAILLDARPVWRFSPFFKRTGFLEKAEKRAAFLTEKLAERLGSHPHVGEIRHIGLIHALELVEDKASKKGYPPEERVGYQVYKKLWSAG